jgi:hypothetical protein
MNTFSKRKGSDSDEWSLVDLDDFKKMSMTSECSTEDNQRNEPEIEAEPESYQLISKKQNKLTIIIPPKEEPLFQGMNSLSLLPDNNENTMLDDVLTSYSQEERHDMLSQRHQRRYFQVPRKLFCVVEHRKSTAAASSVETQTDTLPDLHAPCALLPTLTQVTPFTMEQGTQVNLKKKSVKSKKLHHDAGTSTTAFDDLQKALERSMMYSNQLHSKNQEYERLSLQVINLEAELAFLSTKHEKDQQKLQDMERRMHLASDRDAMAVHYQEYLKQQLDESRVLCSSLQIQNDFFSGKIDHLDSYSVEELEQLDIALSKNANRIRDELRTRYQKAIEISSKQKDTQENYCVVCFTRPVSVILLPCRHQVLCSACALRMSSCPIDRKPITDKILSYGLRAFIQ